MAIEERRIKGWWGGLDIKLHQIIAVEGSGNLICNWKEEAFMEIDVHEGSRRICVKGLAKEIDFHCAIMVVYGWHTRSKRANLW